MSDILTRVTRTRRRHLTFTIHNGKRRESATEQRSFGEKWAHRVLADYQAARRCPESYLDVGPEEDMIPLLHNGVFVMEENDSVAATPPDWRVEFSEREFFSDEDDENEADNDNPFGLSEILVHGGSYIFMKHPCGRRLAAVDPDRNYEWPH